MMGIEGLKFPHGDISMFLKRIEELGGEWIHVERVEDGFGYVEKLIEERGIGSCVIEGGDFFKPLIERLGNVEILDFEEIQRADIGISKAVLGINETGTILIPRNGVSEFISLLPPLHIAFLAESSILPGIDSAIKKMEELSIYSGIFITGPSRTADIEQTLTLGVHGPKEVIVVIYGKS